MSFTGLMDKQSKAHPYNRILQQQKERIIDTFNSMAESQHG